MIIEKFTPEVLISAPRRGPAIPNHDGSLAVYTESTYVDEKSQREFYLLEVTTGKSSLILRDNQACEPSWLGDGTNTVIYLRRESTGFTFVFTLDIDLSSPEPILAGHIRAPVQCLKTKALGDGTLAFTVLGYVDVDGQPLNTDRRRINSGRVYSSSQLRLADLQNEPHAYTVWYSFLSKQCGAWRIAGDLHNALGGTSLHVSHETGRHGDSRGLYDLSKNGIVVAAESTENCGHGQNGASNIYFIHVPSFEIRTFEVPMNIKVKSSECRGVCTLPQFSPDGSLIGFLRTEGSNREQWQIYVYNSQGSQNATSVFDIMTGRPWPLTPADFRFSAAGNSLYITAEDSGQVGLYHLDLQPNAYPQPLSRNGTVSAFYPSGQNNSGTVMVTSSSFIDSCFYQVFSNDFASEPITLSSVSKDGSKFGLSPNQISDISFGGGGNYTVHAWIVKPRNFDERKKWPLAILIHDNTHNTAWLNSWNQTWNAAVWAEQGYVVVLPNITGSTGYAQDFATAIHDDWSSRPYDDVANCVCSVRDIPGVDVDNAVIAGSGYGGYLMNWIQGQPLAREFKAMVCHAGIFNTRTIAARSCPLEFRDRVGGLPISESSINTQERCNPAQPSLLRNWNTPMLVIHNERDLISPISEGLVTYNHLQSSDVPTEFLTFADEGHSVVKEENRLAWYRHVFSWINQYTGMVPGRGQNGGSSAT